MQAYTPAEALARETFLALMQALSFPGKIQTLPDYENPFAAIAHTLLDLETTCYTPDADLRDNVSSTGTRSAEPETAAYHFYPQLDNLNTLRKASVGTMLYPDHGATLVIGCSLGAGRRFTLSGPGIQTTREIQVEGLPREFWELREEKINYPLGWDIFLVDGQQVLGLPRTTVINQE